jgi:protein-disulfide isomerase
MQSAAAAQSRDQWVEEILLQLSELRKSQGDLLKQVEALQAQVTTLKAAGAQDGGSAALDLRDPKYPSLGDAKAQVAVVEFSDFECPFCRRHKQGTLPSLTQNYVNAGTVRYYFVDYPLSFHAHAMEAAVAGACAHQQGAFWKMHDLLFENQSKLGNELYLRLAADLGLDKGKFQSCLADPKVKKQIGERSAVGDRVGVQGTPAFLIGRLKDGMLTEAHAISGARPLGDFEKVLNKYMSGS